MAGSNESDFQLPLFAGVDVGGTNIKVGIVDDLGRVVADSKFPTPSDDSAKAFEQAAEMIETLLNGTSYSSEAIKAVGLGTPGPLDLERGRLLTPVNLPGWHNADVRDQLAAATGKPVAFANDANAAAYGEFWVGGGRDDASMVLLTLGTGVGGGIIIDEVMIDGAQSHAAEVGHMVVDTGADARKCKCGVAGHLEAYASATAVVERTAGLLPQYPNSQLMAMIGETSALSALMVSNAASAGDELSIRIVDETADYLARGIAILAHVINPATFILGGAMNFGGNDTALGRKFRDRIVMQARSQLFPLVAQNLKVEFAQLGGAAGFIGAAGVARAASLKG